MIEKLKNKIEPNTYLYIILFLVTLFSNIKLFGIPILYLTLFFLFLFYLFLMIKHTGYKLYNNNIFLMWVAFFIVNLITLINVINFGNFLTGFRVFFAMFLVNLLYIFAPLKKKQVDIIMSIFLTVLGLFSIITIYTLVKDPDLVQHRPFIGTPWLRSNALASLWASSFPISIAYFLKEKNKKIKIYFVVLSILYLIGIILTTSRGGTLILFIGIVLLIIYYIFNNKSKNKKFKVLISLFSIFLGAIILTKMPYIDSFIINLMDRMERAFSGNTNGRLFLWKNAIEAWKNNILFGNGFYNLNEFSGIEQQIRAHNFILELLASSGLLGATLYIGIIFLSLKSILYNKLVKKDVLLFSILVSIFMSIIHSLIEPVLTVLVLGTIFWLKIAILKSIRKEE